MQNDNTLSQHCLQLAQAVTEASAWAMENQEVTRSEQEGLLTELRRSGRIFRQCARAAMRKMCAGVFGPSQAGKSYLISALARDATGSLMALFGAEVKDFIAEINPEGGKESTGLVTRFTMTRPVSLPDGFPVHIKLLTETDLVKIIANTYFSDCEHKEAPDTNAITKCIDDLQSRKGTGSPHINLDALEDLREYLVKDFQGKPRVQELDRCGYWKRIFELGPQLDLENRIQMYGVIWDNVGQFTDLLRLLLRALENLGYAPEAFCPLEALIPRVGSIIDVATLAGLADSTADSELSIRTEASPPVSLARSVVTALTAELTIVMREKPDDYFDHTDLLDFPGYRSRFKFSDVRKELEKPDMAKDLFLRGKVAYLFQRYCAERELTSMLLCIGPSNQEVQDLPVVINDWIISTHGELPESRRDKPVALYFILTKFDMEFEQKKGAPSVETRWDNRLHASLLDFFGKQHDWPKIWDGKESSFRNLYLLRNPNFDFKAILEYDENNREKGIRPDQQGYVASLESAFMNSKYVAAHFKDPRGAWDAAMRLNDGGISYIRDSLRPLCNPDIKRAQIETTLAERKNRLALRLQAFYRSDDKEEKRRQKALLSRSFGQIFARMLQNQNMGEFLRRLCVQDNELYELYFEARRRFLESEEDTGHVTHQVSVGSGTAADDIMAELFGSEPQPAQTMPEEDTPVFTPSRPKDEAQYFAELIEAHWCNRLQALSDNPSIQKYYAFSPAELSKLVAELTLGASRLKLREDMEKALRAAAAYSNTAKERIVWQQVGMAASILNGFVDWLGRNPRTRAKEDRTVFMGGNSYVLFTPAQKPDGFPVLPEIQEPFEKAWFMDWLRALHVLLQENVDFEDGQMYNREQNTRLGEIIKTVSSAA